MREVDVDTVIVDQHTLHLEICTLAILFAGKLDESILQTITSLFIADDFTRQNFAEAAEDEFEVLVAGDRVQLADEEDLFRRCDIGEG